MYSLVLMSAMSTAPATADFNGFFRDLFHGNNCSGCCGGAIRYSCSGGCSGSSCCGGGCCGGCCGGSFLGIRDSIRSWWNADGCCGGGCCGGSARYAGCCGGVAYGCCGSSSYSCYGGPAVSYTPVFNGGLSCYGGPVMAAPAPVFDAVPVYPGATPSAPAPTIPYAAPEAAPGAGPMIVPERSGLRPAGFTGPATMVGASGGARATVLVRLPADARLYADGTPLRMAGGERKFVTPELPADMEYTYQLKAEYERNGELLSVTKKVAVRAGGSAAVEFADLTAARVAPGGADVPVAKIGEPVAAAPVSLTKPAATLHPGPYTPGAFPTAAPPPAGAPATLTVKLPPGAVLLVDGQRSPTAGPVRRFSTPPLPAGKEFAYLLRVEVGPAGQPGSVSLTEKVVFRAGEQRDVDFTTFGPGR